ncbi:MAG TPA: response regulator transcription factor [Chloroflexota bacterium]|nr:response regulator transcription factor [Chloroflexota bacterium]
MSAVPRGSETILAIDDDVRMLRLIRLNLERVGYTVRTEQAPEEGLVSAEMESPDLVLLDVMMPGMDGFTLLSRLREFSNVPVIMLTAKGEEADKVRGLDLGADDYLTKPFGPRELLARVRAALRRMEVGQSGATARISFGELTIFPARRRVERNGRPIHLTPTEYRLLYELAANRDRVLLHDELLTRVWGPEYRDEVDYLWTYVRYLRNKIEPDPASPRYIHSQAGVGYYIADHAETA